MDQIYNRDMTWHALTDFLCSLSLSFPPTPSHSVSLDPSPFLVWHTLHLKHAYYAHSLPHAQPTCSSLHSTLISGIHRVAVAGQCGRQAGTTRNSMIMIMMGYRASASHRASSSSPSSSNLVHIFWLTVALTPTWNHWLQAGLSVSLTF